MTVLDQIAENVEELEQWQAAAFCLALALTAPSQETCDNVARLAAAMCADLSPDEVLDAQALALAWADQEYAGGTQ